jgi:hypothetical protein
MTSQTAGYPDRCWRVHGRCFESIKIRETIFLDQAHKKRGGDSSRRRCSARVTKASMQKIGQFSYVCEQKQCYHDCGLEPILGLVKNCPRLNVHCSNTREQEDVYMVVIDPMPIFCR